MYFGQNWRILHHEATELDPKLWQGEVVSLVIGTRFGPKESPHLVVPRHSWPADLDDVHVIAGNTWLPNEHLKLLE
jgi:hypothetical protein